MGVLEVRILRALLSIEPNGVENVSIDFFLVLVIVFSCNLAAFFAKFYLTRFLRLHKYPLEGINTKHTLIHIHPCIMNINTIFCFYMGNISVINRRCIVLWDKCV